MANPLDSLLTGLIPGGAVIGLVGGSLLNNNAQPVKLDYPKDLLEVNSSTHKPRYLRIGIWNYAKALSTNDISTAAKSQLNAGLGAGFATINDFINFSFSNGDVVGGAAPIQNAAVNSALQGIFAAGAFFGANRAGFSENQVTAITGAATALTAGVQEGINRTRGLLSQVGTTPFSEGVINIYASPDMKFNYGTNWNNSTFGGTASAGGAVQQVFAGIQGNIESFQKSITEDIAKLSKFPNVNVSEKALLGATTGRVFNDNSLQTFDSVAHRAFNYEFLLVPRNSDEAKIINNIIRSFKIGMLPSVNATESLVGLLLNYPRVFTITPMIGDKPNPNIPRSKFCALKNMGVDYAPDGMFASIQEDGMPPAVRLSLDFIELTTLTANEIINPGLSNSGDPQFVSSGSIL